MVSKRLLRENFKRRARTKFPPIQCMQQWPLKHSMNMVKMLISVYVWFNQVAKV